MAQAAMMAVGSVAREPLIATADGCGVVFFFPLNDLNVEKISLSDEFAQSSLKEFRFSLRSSR